MADFLKFLKKNKIPILVCFVLLLFAARECKQTRDTEALQAALKQEIEQRIQEVERLQKQALEAQEALVSMYDEHGNSSRNACHERVTAIETLDASRQEVIQATVTGDTTRVCQLLQEILQ